MVTFFFILTGMLGAWPLLIIGIILLHFLRKKDLPIKDQQTGKWINNVFYQLGSKNWSNQNEQNNQIKRSSPIVKPVGTQTNPHINVNDLKDAQPYKIEKTNTFLIWLFIIAVIALIFIYYY